MQKCYSFFVICLVSFSGICQDDYVHRMSANFRILDSLPAVLTQYIPKGYAAMDTLTGDLNKDNYQDFVMILKEIDEDTIYSRITKRPLLLLTGQPDGSLKLAARNDNVVYCISCGGVMGDPYQQTVIKNGYFSVEMYGGSSWRWTRIITFKYSKEDNDWYLHKDGGDTFHATEPEETMKEYLRTTKDFGKIRFSDFNYDSE